MQKSGITTNNIVDFVNVCFVNKSTLSIKIIVVNAYQPLIVENPFWYVQSNYMKFIPADDG